MENRETLCSLASAYIRSIFSSDFSGHDAEHSFRVYRTALQIARKENADLLLVSLGALLHDVDDKKLFPDNKNDDNARKFLSDNNVPKDIEEKIIRIIHQVSFKGKDSVKPDTLEGEVVQDADRLDAIGAIGIARAFAYGGSHQRPLYLENEKYKKDMSEEEYRKNNGSTIAHFYEKLLLLEDMMNTKEAKRLAEGRTEVLKDFLAEFDSEIKGAK
ncbi:MAG: HD domain-containing protein [Bacilli bacterium]